jgi:hypothetical protein
MLKLVASKKLKGDIVGIVGIFDKRKWRTLGT